MTKPSNKPQIANNNYNNGPLGGANKQEPSATLKDEGWSYEDYVNADNLNWLFAENKDWIDYLEERTDSTSLLSDPFSRDSDSEVGALEFGVFGGSYKYAGTLIAVAADVLTMTPSATNYIVINTDTDILEATTSTPTPDQIIIWTVVTDGSGIISSTDLRLAPKSKRVPTDEIEDGAVTTTKMAANSVVGDVLQLGLEWKTGLLVSNNSTDADHDIDVAAGSIMDTTNVYRMSLASSFTKRIDATFAVGTGNGGLSDVDTLGNNICYGVWLLSKSTDPTDCDVIFATTRARSLADAVATAAGFDISRLIGYGITDATSDFLPYILGGNELVTWDVTQVNHYITSALNTTGTGTAIVTMTAPPFQPVYFNAAIRQSDALASRVLFNNTGQTNTNPNVAGLTHLTCLGDGTNNSYSAVNMVVKSDASQQIRYRANLNPSGLEFSMATIGYYIDRSVTDLV